MNFMNRKLFKTRPARDKLNKMGGIMSSSQPLMQTVQQFNVGGGVQAPNNPAFFSNFQTVPRQFGLGPQGQARALMARVPSAQANREKLQEFDRQTIVNPLMQLLSGRKAFDTEQLVQPTSEAQIAASQTPTLRGPTAGDVQGKQAEEESDRLASEILGDSMELTTPAGTPDVTTEVVEDVTEDADIAEDSPVTSATEGTDPGTAVREVSAIAEADLPDETKGAAISSVWKSVLSSDADPIEVNDLILEMGGKKDPEKNISRKERIQNNIETYKELFGEEPDKNMKEDGFNLAYLGFAIAAGDSPNALQNIARGSMEGLKKISETQKAREERKDRAKMFGLKQALQEESDIKKEEQRMFELKFGAGLNLARDRFKSDQELRKWAATQTLAERRLDREIAARIELQDQKDISAAERDRLNRESAELRTIRGQLPEAANLWLEMNPNADITTEEGAKAALDGMVGIAGQLGTEELGTRKPMSPEDRQYNARTEVLDRDKITPGVYVDEAGNFTAAGVTLYNNLLKGPATTETPPPAADGAGTTQRITLEPDAS